MGSEPGLGSLYMFDEFCSESILTQDVHVEDLKITRTTRCDFYVDIVHSLNVNVQLPSTVVWVVVDLEFTMHLGNFKTVPRNGDTKLSMQLGLFEDLIEFPKEEDCMSVSIQSKLAENVETKVITQNVNLPGVKQVKYTLVKVTELCKIIANKRNYIDSPIDESMQEKKKEIYRFHSVLENYEEQFTDLQDKLLKVEFSLPTSVMTKINSSVNVTGLISKRIVKGIKDLTLSIQSRQYFTCMNEFVYLNKDLKFLVKLVKIKDDFFKPLIEFMCSKCQMLKLLLAKGIQYVGPSSSFDSNTIVTDYCLVLHLCRSKQLDQTALFDYLELYFQYINSVEEYNAEFSYVVKDYEPGADDSDYPIIQLYRGSDLIVDNIIYDSSTKSYVTSANKQKLEAFPSEISYLTLRCPGSECLTSIRTWYCVTCDTRILCDANKRCYCECGVVAHTDLRFKCSDLIHTDFIQYPWQVLFLEVKTLVPIKSINLLLLGQSGVGKSTWINGILNYLTYTSFEEAMDSEIQVAVPSKFSLYENEKKIVVEIGGKNKNEDQSTGVSATQGCQTYTLFCKEHIVRLIDTPGLADTRGYIQDKKNIENIICHLETIGTIHGICVLLKPNESRESVTFSYCLKEILSFLHKNLRDRIVFCFTNVRATFYKPGDSYAILKNILSELKANVYLSDSTVYCIDNEAFRFLCALRNGIEYSAKDQKTFAESWSKAVEQTQRMFYYFQTSTGCEVEDINFVSSIRKKIIALSNITCKVNDEIETQRMKINYAQKEIDQLKANIEELSKNNKKTVLEQTVDNVNRIVCTHCVSEFYDTQPLYKTVCCATCQETAQLNVIPCADLRKCQITMKSGVTCVVCNCRWEKHMMINYQQTKVEQVVSDVASETATQNVRIQFLQSSIKCHEKTITSLDKEKVEISSLMSKFGSWLKDKAICPSNSALIPYLDYLLQNLSSKPDKTEEEEKKIKDLQAQSSRYSEEIKILEEVKLHIKDLDCSLKEMMAQARVFEIKYGMKSDHNGRRNLATSSLNILNVSLNVMEKRGRGRPRFVRSYSAERCSDYSE